MADNILTKDRADADIALAAKDNAGVLFPRNILTDPSGADITPLTDAQLRAAAVPMITSDSTANGTLTGNGSFVAINCEGYATAAFSFSTGTGNDTDIYALQASVDGINWKEVAAYDPENSSVAWLNGVTIDGGYRLYLGACTGYKSIRAYKVAGPSSTAIDVYIRINTQASSLVTVSNTVYVEANNTLPVSCSDLATLVDALHQEDTPHTSGHYGQLMLGIRADSDAPTADNGDYTVLKLDEEGRLKVASKPASYAATVGNVTSATSAIPMNCERFSNLMIHCTGTFSTVNCTFEGSLNSTNGTDGAWFAVQAIRSNANTIETTTGNLSAAPAYAWELSVNALKYFRVRATAWTSGTQVWTMIPGTYATEPIPGAQVSATQPVSGTVTATNTTPTPLNTSSAATTNPILVKGSAGTLFNVSASNTGAGIAYLKFYNKATAPTVGTDVPVLTIPIPASGVISVPFGTLGHRFATGVGIGITGGAADNDTTAVAAAQVKVLTSYV